jgi:putative membrane protein
MKKAHVLTFAILAALVYFLAPTRGLAATNEATVLKKIHLINQTEINAGKLAEERASTASAKEFGAMLVRDHTAADQKVTALANEQRINLREVSADELKKVQIEGDELMRDLRSTGPGDFDRIFAKRMEAAHSKAVKDLETARTELIGTRTADLIAELLPSLRTHEHKAAAVERQAE